MNRARATLAGQPLAELRQVDDPLGRPRRARSTFAEHAYALLPARTLRRAIDDAPIAEARLSDDYRRMHDAWILDGRPHRTLQGTDVQTMRPSPRIMA